METKVVELAKPCLTVVMSASRPNGAGWNVCEWTAVVFLDRYVEYREVMEFLEANAINTTCVLVIRINPLGGMELQQDWGMRWQATGEAHNWQVPNHVAFRQMFHAALDSAYRQLGWRDDDDAAPDLSGPGLPEASNN